jgi:hypothetical protein
MNKIILTFSEIEKNRFRNDSSSDIDYSMKTIWNTTGKLLQEKCHDEYKLTFNPFCDVVPNVCLNCSFGNLSRQIQGGPDITCQKNSGSLEGSNKSKIVVYLTSSCVNWGFLARVGQFATRVKRPF